MHSKFKPSRLQRGGVRPSVHTSLSYLDRVAVVRRRIGGLEETGRDTGRRGETRGAKTGDCGPWAVAVGKSKGEERRGQNDSEIKVKNAKYKFPHGLME